MNRDAALGWIRGMAGRTTRLRGTRDAVRTAFLVLACVVLALLPFKGALGAVGHPCNGMVTPASQGHVDLAAHGEHAGGGGHESHAEHPAPGIPGAGCATCALHCSVVIGFGDGLPLQQCPAPLLIAFSPVAAPPGLNPAPADPPPRS